MALHAVFEKAVDSAGKTDPPVCLVSEPFEVYTDTNVKTCLNDVYSLLLNYIDIDERNGLGWVLSRLEALDITIWLLDPIRASSYHRLPTWIINKFAVTNVRNTGNDCFKWAFLAGMHPTKRNSDRLKKYESFQSKYDFSSLTYPVPLKDIDTFCRRNNCSINVYGISGGKDDQDDDYEIDIENDQDFDYEIDIDDNYEIDNKDVQDVDYEINITDDYEIDIDDNYEIGNEDDQEVDEISENNIKSNEQEKEGIVYPLKAAKVII